MKIAPEIIVETHPDYFVFSKGERQFRLDTCLNYIIEDGQFRLVNIGENKEIPGTRLMNLFDPENAVEPELDKMFLLQTFFEIGIGESFESKLLPQLRPSIIFRNDAELDGLLCGYQRALLEFAALLGGARDVRFE